MERWARALHAATVGGWLGAAAITGFVVAPHAFAAFPTRAQAGDYVGGILRILDGAAIAAGLVAGGLALMRGGGRARLAAAALLVLVGIASLLLDAKLAGMRAAMGPIDALAADDPRRRHFGILHGISMLILLFGMLAALGSLWLGPGQGSSRSSSSG